MPDLAFYNAGCGRSSGVRRIVVLARRLVRRLLRPIFLHQVALYQYLVERLDGCDTSVKGVQAELETLTRQQNELNDRVETFQAFGWDYVAMVRRLAVLEDQLATLTGQAPAPFDEADTQASIRFPGLEIEPTPEARSKVC